MKRLCGAKTRVGGRCSKPAMPDSARCRWHGARAGRPRGTPMHENTRVALRTGRARWVERMRQAKAAGLIERFPNGRRPKGAPKLSSNKKIAKAQRIVEVWMAEVEAKGVPATPWAQLTKAQKLSSNADLSLDVTRRILELGVDPRDPKTLALVKDVALSTIAMQIKVEQGKLSPSGSLPPEPALPREITIVVSPEKAAGYDLAIERARRGE